MNDTPKIPITKISPSMESLDFLRRLVESTGGEWLGVQSDFLEIEWELWFKNPDTDHSMFVKFNPKGFDGSELAQKVVARLQTDDEEEEKRYVHVPVRVLKQLADKFLKLSQEIAALYEEKR